MHCKNCDALLPPTAGTDVCPNCGENPYKLNPEKTFLREELEGHRKFFKKKKAA